jgi:16S rRNA processing protein RimM
MRTPRLVVIGKVLKPFGIRGEVKVQSFASSLAPFSASTSLFLDEEEFVLVSARSHKGAALITLQGVNTPERARELVGRVVRTDRANFPPLAEDEYYLHELVGMEVIRKDGAVVGAVRNIIETGANDVLEIVGPYGEALIPHVEGVVLDVDFDAGIIRIDPPEGLIPDA